MSCSGWSAVLRIDTDGGTPDGYFTKGGGRVAARRRPSGCSRRWRAASNLICEVDNEPRPLRQIPAPKVMILKGLRKAGKPG